ncbi:Group 3 truncated hemoglobin ctb [Pandoraea iniqua]|uniref:Group 3 truncated hemoglobin ctb n=1 Tax=Pandoraea iniqua TaxID=2508288 RepID=A0A5E4ZAK3_9BURK|nr:group III truncated hemoglobin [Pandoraea iniqua]VVE57193.1 Group 3 truncated hemoglobin ctb [Pandoraea iniqua]
MSQHDRQGTGSPRRHPAGHRAETGDKSASGRAADAALEGGSFVTGSPVTRPGAWLEMLPAKRLAQVDEAAVQLLVHTFYGRIRDDDLLGPVFRQALEGRWDMHLEKMVAFWSSIVLGAKRYRGNVTQAHQPFAHLTGEHFSRWLVLFFDTLDALFEPEAAFAFAEPAIRIAESLQLNLFGWEYALPPAQRALLESVKAARPARPHE